MAGIKSLSIIRRKKKEGIIINKDEIKVLNNSKASHTFYLYAHEINNREGQVESVCFMCGLILL